ncbi:galectin-4-like [Ostrea edulis]|uniref:galectin-4-like n=1 Tax=Ostrea edulis TaxID=37623 RepID=UPI0024AF1992|nr:galectin-4-like [Ostrea edulis]
MQTVGRVDNPVLPFEGDIPGGLQPGKQVFIQGDFPVGGDSSFGINFKCGRGNADVAFHFNTRVGQGCVVRNTLQNGSWQQEERGGGLPFSVGQHFEMIFLVEEKQFKVAVNGKHFIEYRHRIPIARVNILQITHGINVRVIRYDAPYSIQPAVHYPPANVGYNPGPPPANLDYTPPMGCLPPVGSGSYGKVTGPCIGFGVPHQAMGYTPPPGPGYTPPPSNSAYPSMPQDITPIYNPPVPFIGFIPPSGLTNGKLLHISGVTGPNRFSVNIQDNPGEPCDIAFHFDVRLNVNEIVRNTKSNGQWGAEERQNPYLPFRPNANFDMMILCEEQCFKVAVDGKHFIEYKHRLQPLDRFKYLNIVGDAKITQIRFQ